MLPFATYQIPEAIPDKTAMDGRRLVFVCQKPSDELSMDLLSKISTALKADFKSEVLLHFIDTGEEIQLSSLGANKPQLVISFGVPPGQLGLWLDLEKAGIRELEAFTFILTLTPEKLNSNAIAKKELWQHMQTFMETQKENA